MKNMIRNLDTPKKLGLVALVLGFFAIFAGSPYKTPSVNVNTEELAVTSLDKKSKIEVTELADWIIKRKADFRIVDLRDGDKYAEYFIPTAVNIKPGELLDSRLLRNEKIVLYSEDNTRAAQAWFILKANDYKGVYILEGGIDGWKNDILFPSLPKDASGEEAREFEKLAEVSKFFGGQPTRGGEKVEKEMKKMPELKPPAQLNLKAPSGRKKREGC